MNARIALVHGIGRRLQDWDAVVPALADLGEVLPVDLAGFGAEPPPGDVRVLPHAGHLIPLEGPGDVVDAVRAQVALGQRSRR